MIRNTFNTACLCLAATLLYSCASQKSIKTKETASDNGIINNEMSNIDDNFLILSDSQRNTLKQNNTFAINLLKTQIGMDSKVVSPISVSMLMAMLANGAKDNTQKEILRTITGNDKQTLQNINEAFKCVMPRNDGKESVQIKMANYIAANKNTNIKNDYADVIKSVYSAEIESLDFASANTTRHINDWCSKQTEGMIPKIVGQLNADDMAVIMNAIYFKGQWTNKFDPADTKQENFHGYTRDIKKVHMMHQNSKFRYAEFSEFAAVEMPYNNSNFVMTVILPNQDKSATEIANRLNAEKMDEIDSHMENCYVDLKMPRFTISTEIQLNDIISKLGAPSVFDAQKANFSAIADGGMYVSKMLQKAKIEVNETGTKAAAVTAAIMTMTALGPNEPRHVSFHANRPFIYIISDRNTGVIFFAGQFTGTDNQ